MKDRPTFEFIWTWVGPYPTQLLIADPEVTELVSDNINADCIKYTMVNYTTKKEK